VQSIEIRPFRRSDRDQLTALVNLHVQAVVPAIGVSVNALMSQLEREPGEAVVDPWVIERKTLVAIERDAIVAGAHLLRYWDDERVGESYRGAAEIRWLVCAHDATEAGNALAAACLAAMDAWGAERQYADGSLPAPFVYGIPASWPHIRELIERAGFVHDGRVEILLVAKVEELPRPAEPPLPGLELRRTLGTWPRFSAMLDDERVGFVEVDTYVGGRNNLPRVADWGDIGNLFVREQDRRKGVATWLLGHAAEWLRLGEVSRLVTYATPEQEDELAFNASVGFRELVRTERSWTRRRT
jgi:GNAT superfamily N-acetyltransferase